MVELDAVFIRRENHVLRANLNLHNIRANGGAIQPTQSAEFQSD